MSFKDSKIAAAANSAMTLSAELAVDTEEYTLCTFTVNKALNNDGNIQPSEDWYTSFVNMILGHVAEAKQYADEAKASAASINVDDIKADVKTSVMNDLNGTVTESLKAYYTKTEVDTKVEELNTAISSIDSLKNLKVEYDNTTGNLIFKDGTESI